MIPAVTLLKDNSNAINRPARVAPNIGISVKMKVTMTVNIAKFESMAGNAKLKQNTTTPDSTASIPDTVNCPDTYPVTTLYICPANFW